MKTRTLRIWDCEMRGAKLRVRDKYSAQYTGLYLENYEWPSELVDDEPPEYRIGLILDVVKNCAAVFRQRVASCDDAVPTEIMLGNGVMSDGKEVFEAWAVDPQAESTDGKYARCHVVDFIRREATEKEQCSLAKFQRQSPGSGNGRSLPELARPFPMGANGVSEQAPWLATAPPAKAKVAVPNLPARPAKAAAGGGVVAPAARYLIQRGVNHWRVVFNGVELPGLGKDRGMFFVAYLAGHAGGDAIHALELEGKVAKHYRKECGLTEIVDPDRGVVVPVDAEAVMQEYDLNIDNQRMAELMQMEERKALATIGDQTSSPGAKADAAKKIEAIRLFRLNRFGKNVSAANDAARRVRVALDRLLESLLEIKSGNAQETRAVAAFVDYVRVHIRDASARLWPKVGLRSHKSKWLPGHFLCEMVEGIDWVVM